MMRTDILLKARYAVRKSLIELRKIRALIYKDKYDRIAAELQDLLLQNWNDQARHAITDVIRAIKGSDRFSNDDLDGMIRGLDRTLGSRFAGRVAADMEQIHTSTYAEGLDDVIGFKPSFNIVDRKAIGALQSHNVFWVKNFFEQQLREKAVTFGEQIIEQGLNRTEAGALFEAEFAEKFEAFSFRYWQGFANHVVTRSRELGAVSGYERAGIEWLEVRAIRDHRTTQVCLHMHGRRIRVSRAVEIRDALIASEDPRDVKNIAPWPDADAIARTPSNKLPGGAILPPYHFNCRTRTIKWRERPGSIDISDVDVSDEAAGTTIGNRIRHAVDNQERLSRAETGKLIEYAQRSKWGSHKIKGKTAVRYHYDEHKDDFGIDSLDRYNQEAVDLIRRGDRDAWIGIKALRHPQMYFRRGEQTLILDVGDNRIQSFHIRSDRDWDYLLSQVKFMKLPARGITKWLKKLFNIT